MYPKKDTSGEKMWFGYIEPFKIMKKIFFVGGYQASIHVVDTGDGLVIMDTGYAKPVYTIVDGIYRMGYRMDDVKYIFLSHWHVDHTEGVTQLLSVCKNAKTVIGKYDDVIAKEHGLVDADIVVNDGDTIKLGDITFRFIATPGHTIGTVSVFFDYEEDGKIYNVGTFGGAGPASIMPDDSDYYDGCQEAYFSSIERLKGEHVDIFLGNHCWNNDTDGKAKRLKENPNVNPFIDDKEFPKFLEHCKQRAERMIKEYNEAHNKVEG